MTTKFSKHELQSQIQQQQQQQQRQQQQPQRTLNTFSNNLLTNIMKPTIPTTITLATSLTTTTAAATTALTVATSATTIATASVDSATRIILIDSINNNYNKNNNGNNYRNERHSNNINNVNTNSNGTVFRATASTTLAPCPESPTATIPKANFNHADATADIIEIEPETLESVSPQPCMQKRLSLLNFKSLDFHLKSLYTGLRGKNSQSQSSSLGGVTVTGPTNDSDSISTETPSLATGAVNGCRRAATIQYCMPPYLKIESVDAEESENLLLDYPQSPYSSRRNSSPQDNNRSSSQLLHIDRYEITRSQATSPSPYFLSPYAHDSGTVRRSSTSDIASCKRSGSSNTSDSRRPSTSDLLRRARERRSTDARMGRSVSHSGIPRGGRGGPGGAGGRRTSMAL